MRLYILQLTFFALMGISVRADITSTIDALTDSYDRIVADIENAPAQERSQLHEKLREHVAAMAYASASYPNGGNTLNKERSDEILVGAVYGAFSADQFHLVRVTIHTQDGARAMAIMPDRARDLISFFPFCSSASDNPIVQNSLAFSECIYFIQYLARAYQFIPDSLVREVKQRMPQWRGEQMIPGLLVLAERGDVEAKADLDRLDSEAARKLKVIFRVLVDASRKKEDKKAESGPGE